MKNRFFFVFFYRMNCEMFLEDELWRVSCKENVCLCWTAYTQRDIYNVRMFTNFLSRLFLPNDASLLPPRKLLDDVLATCFLHMPCSSEETVIAKSHRRIVALPWIRCFREYRNFPILTAFYFLLFKIRTGEKERDGGREVDC